MLTAPSGVTLLTVLLPGWRRRGCRRRRRPGPGAAEPECEGADHARGVTLLTVLVAVRDVEVALHRRPGPWAMKPEAKVLTSPRGVTLLTVPFLG